MKLNEKKKQTAYRIIIYSAGLIILALGITLNTKCGLGVSPIISVAYSVSVITNISIGNTTLIWYSVFVLIEVIIHGIKRYGGKQIVSDILQVPLSLVFTRFINLFSGCIPQLDTECKGTVWGTIWMRIIVLLTAIILTGIGAAMSLNMRIIPNPGDGIVQTVADCTDKTVGFTKNIWDIFMIILTCCVSLIFAHHIIGIGIGTLMAMLGVGRVIAIFNHFTMLKMLDKAGLEINFLPGDKK